MLPTRGVRGLRVVMTFLLFWHTSRRSEGNPQEVALSITVTVKVQEGYGPMAKIVLSD